MPMDGRYFARSQEGGAIMPMDGRQIFAPAISAFPQSMAVVFRREPGGDAPMPMDRITTKISKLILVVTMGL